MVDVFSLVAAEFLSFHETLSLLTHAVANERLDQQQRCALVLEVLAAVPRLLGTLSSPLRRVETNVPCGTHIGVVSRVLASCEFKTH